MNYNLQLNANNHLAAQNHNINIGAEDNMSGVNEESNRLQHIQEFAGRAYNKTKNGLQCMSSAIQNSRLVVSFNNNSKAITKHSKNFFYLFSQIELALASSNSSTPNVGRKEDLANATILFAVAAASLDIAHSLASSKIKGATFKTASIFVSIAACIGSSFAIHASAKSGYDENKQKTAEILSGLSIGLIGLSSIVKIFGFWEYCSCCVGSQTDSGELGAVPQNPEANNNINNVAEEQQV